MKVVGVGYPRTGTKTLRQCFSVFGFKNPASWHRETYTLYLEGRVDELLNRAAGYDSFEDLPWCCLFKELDIRFPGSKFVLTRRRTERAWYESARKLERRILDQEFWPSSGTVFERETSSYRNHNEGVREYFKSRPNDLLEVCWEEGDAWKELATFLGRPVPEIPFPHENKTPLEHTFLIFRSLLRDLSQGSPLDNEQIASSLKELIEALPAMTHEQQGIILNLLDQLPDQRWFSTEAHRIISGPGR